MIKVYDKLYRLILKKIVPRVPEKRILVPFTESLKLRYFSRDFEGFLSVIRTLYNLESFKMLEDLFIVDALGDVIKIQDHSQAEEIADEGIIEPRCFVRYWPTVPPHFSSKDLDLADRLDLNAIASFTKEGNELHIFMIKGDWFSFRDVRRRVAVKLLNMAEEISLSIEKEGKPRLSEPDEISYGEGVIKILPHIESERRWKKAINLLTFSYLSEELPQYLYLKLTL